MSQAVPQTTVSGLLERYDALLIDAYGVLVQGDTAIPGVAAFIDHLNARGTSYLILTNDASKTPKTTSAKLASFGISVPSEQIVTSGSLLSDYFAENGLVKKRCVVLGTEDSFTTVREAGGAIVDPESAEGVDVVVVADEEGYAFLDRVDATVSLLFRQLDRGASVDLVLPNPDLFYPKGPEAFGIAAGSVALVIEAALNLRYPDRGDLRFVQLGKPHRPIFAEAERRTGTSNMVMIGDQLATDIQGAIDYGIDSVLVTTGLTRIDEHTRFDAICPTWLLPSLSVEP
jgi:HAD superfamily hydrolase (TIGR01450 family)